MTQEFLKEDVKHSSRGRTEIMMRTVVRLNGDPALGPNIIFSCGTHIEAIYTIVCVLGFEVKATQYRIIKLSETGRFGPCGPFINCI